MTKVLRVDYLISSEWIIEYIHSNFLLIICYSQSLSHLKLARLHYVSIIGRLSLSVQHLILYRWYVLKLIRQLA